MVCLNNHLAGDCVIPVGRDEILSHFSGIPAVLYTFHKLHPTITCKAFHPGKTGFFFCAAGTHFAWTKFSYVLVSARPAGMKKLINTLG